MKEASLFQCLAHPVRLRAMHELARRDEACVSDLVASTGTEQTNLSHHLAQLRACGLVTTRQDGKRIQYRIAHPRLIALLDLGVALADHIEGTDPSVCTAEACCP